MNASKMRLTEADLRDRYGWKKVMAPKPWRPTTAGESITGWYGGRTLRNGQFGQYEVVVVHVPQRGALTVSGVQVINLIDAAGCECGWPISIVYGGEQPLKDGKAMKLFDVYVADGERIEAEDLPEVRS